MSKVVSFPGLRKLDKDDEIEQLKKDVVEALITPDADGYIIIRLDEGCLQPEAAWGGVINPHQAIAFLEVIKLNFMQYILETPETYEGDYEDG